MMNYGGEGKKTESVSAVRDDRSRVPTHVAYRVASVETSTEQVVVPEAQAERVSNTLTSRALKKCAHLLNHRGFLVLMYHCDQRPIKKPGHHMPLTE